ncbi:MAG: aminotransferase class I/II-fold pyridoxal phosphate-dependent enzyme, partial [Bryobacter sp.]|nr:aminotransferase class I/II-fold pyridoxal phosphate-dependent enzyme [Bryobacter sp.]
TKFHALPGLRVGALVAPIELARRLWPLREPWTVNVLAEEAALAALADTDHQERSRQFVEEERAWLSQRLAALPDVHPESSTANYLLVRVRNAPALAARLLDRRILVRVIDSGSVRVAVRRREENQQLIAALQEVL